MIIHDTQHSKSTEASVADDSQNSGTGKEIFDLIDETQEKSILSRKDKRKLIAQTFKQLDSLQSRLDVPAKETSPPPKMEFSDSDLSLPLSFIESLNVGVVVNDTYGNIVACNHKAKQLLKCPHTERCALEMRCVSNNVKNFFVYEEDRLRIANELKMAEQNEGQGYILNAPIHIKNCAQKAIPVESSIYNFYDKNRERKGTVNLFLKNIGTQNANIKHIIALTLEALAADAAIFWKVDDAGKSMKDCPAHIELQLGDVDAEYAKKELQVPTPVAYNFVENETPLVIKDLLEENKWQKKYKHYGWAMKHGWVSLLAIPVIVDGNLTGIVNLYWKHAKTFDELDKTFGEIIGKYITLVLTRAEDLDPSILYKFITLYKQQRKQRQRNEEMFKDAIEQRVSRHEAEIQKEAAGRPLYKNHLLKLTQDTFFESENIAELVKFRSFLEDRLKKMTGSVQAESIQCFIVNKRKPFLFHNLARVSNPANNLELRGQPNVNVEETHHLFDLASEKNAKILNIDPDFLKAAKIRLSNLKISKEIKILLRNEGYRYLGDIALMSEEAFYRSFNSLQDSKNLARVFLSQLRRILRENELGFETCFFRTESTFTSIRITNSLSENTIINRKWFEKTVNRLKSNTVMNLLAVPIPYQNPSGNKCLQLAGYFLAVNKMSEVSGDPQLNCVTQGGFSEQDLANLEDEAKFWSDIVSAYS